MLHGSPRLILMALLAAALHAAGCGPSPGGKVPVDSTFYAYQAPEEAVPAEEDEAEEEADEEEEEAAAPAKPGAK